MRSNGEWAIHRHAVIATLAGFCGLGSETIFLKLVDESVGSASLVAFVVVSLFILGMGLGALFSTRIRHPWRIEALLAGYNMCWLILFYPILRWNAVAVAALAPHLGPNVSAALIGAAYVPLPAFLLGFTFPVVVERQGEVALLYRLSALGALLGVLLVEALVFPWLGIRACLALMCVAHLAQAFLLVGKEFELRAVALGRPPGWLLIVGVGTGAFQGAWLMLAQLLFQPRYYVQPLVVATMILGLALGSALFVRWRLEFSRVLSWILFGVTISVAAVVLLLHSPQQELLHATLLQLPLAILPGAIPIGALLPSFLRDRPALRSDAGAALLSLAIGNALGALLAAGVVLRFFSPIISLLVVSAVVGVVRLRFPGGRVATLLCVGAATLVVPWTNDLAFIRRLPGNLGRADRIDALFRGAGELSAIYRVSPGFERLYQTGFSPIALGGAAESVIGFVGAAYSRSLQRALVLGGGSGRSAGTVAKLFARVDVVDVGATVRSLLTALRAENYDLLNRPNVSYHAFDGILAPDVLRGGYDLIVLTVDPGHTAKAAKLYTVESLRRLRRMLRPGGVLVSWADESLGAEANQVLINGGKAVFENQKLFSVYPGQRTFSYYLIIGSDEPLIFHEGNIETWCALLFPSQTRPPVEIPTTEVDRLIIGRAHWTRAVHSLDHPAPSLLLGGYSLEPIPVLPEASP